MQNNNQNLVASINEVGEKVFYDPSPLLPYNQIVIKALIGNTFRAFYRIDKSKTGAGFIFRKVLNELQTEIINSLNNAKSESDVDSLSNSICGKLLPQIEKVVLPTQLQPYNKLRKPFDIFIEHVVALLDEFDPVTRKRLAPLLYLPLDSWMFKSEIVFSDNELKELKLKRNYTYSSIIEESHYLEIQDFLKEKAKRIGVKHRIFFDMVWSNRYDLDGTNLFLTNPPSKKK